MKTVNRFNLTGTGVMILALGLGHLVQAEPLRQHQAHVHGEAVGNLTLDGEDLHLELTVPGVNLAGFEHPPRDQQQRDGLAAVLAELEGGAWLTLDDRGRCERVFLDVRSPGFDEPGVGDDHAHDHHHHDDRHDHGDHHHRDDGPGHEHHEHAEFHLRAHWRCERPAMLRWVDLDLFTGHPGNERLVLDVLTEQHARRERLEPRRVRASLEP